MTTKHDINLNESADVKLSLKGLWSLIVMVAICASIVVGYQMKTDYKIERLYLENATQHESLMLKLNSIDMKQEFFVLRSQLESSLLYSRKAFFEDSRKTNITTDDDRAYREMLSRMLERK